MYSVTPPPFPTGKVNAAISPDPSVNRFLNSPSPDAMIILEAEGVPPIVASIPSVKSFAPKVSLPLDNVSAPTTDKSWLILRPALLFSVKFLMSPVNVEAGIV